MNSLLHISRRLSSYSSVVLTNTNVLIRCQPNSYYSTDMAYNVVHKKDEKEFAIVIKSDSGTEDKAMLQYDYIEPNLVDLYHTEVPAVFRGKGIAKILAKEAINHFLQEDVNMRLSCTYLQKYVKDNPRAEYTKDRITF